MRCRRCAQVRRTSYTWSLHIAAAAADELHGQSPYLSTTLLEFQPHLLVKKSSYKHVNAKAYLMPTSYETGQRRRAQISNTSAGGWLDITDGSPNKKMRFLQEENSAYVAGESPRKEKTRVDGH